MMGRAPSVYLRGPFPSVPSERHPTALAQLWVALHGALGGHRQMYVITSEDSSFDHQFLMAGGGRRGLSNIRAFPWKLCPFIPDPVPSPLAHGALILDFSVIQCLSKNMGIWSPGDMDKPKTLAS